MSARAGAVRSVTRTLLYSNWVYKSGYGTNLFTLVPTRPTDYLGATPRVLVPFWPARAVSKDQSETE